MTHAPINATKREITINKIDLVGSGKVQGNFKTTSSSRNSSFIKMKRQEQEETNFIYQYLILEKKEVISTSAAIREVLSI